MSIIQSRSGALAAFAFALVMSATLISCSGEIIVEGDATGPDPFTDVWVVEPPWFEVAPRCQELVRTGDVVLETVADVQAMSGVTEVTDRLTVRFTDLTSLEGLECLERVGSLVITNNHALRDLAGLSGLRVVNGGAHIEGNASLTSMEGLENLREVLGNLSIADNYGLRSVDGLSRIALVGSDLTVTGHPRLTNLDGFRFLALIGRMLVVADNHDLRSIGLDRLRQVGTGVYIYYNSRLPSCQVSDLCYLLEGYQLDFEPLITNVGHNDDAGLCEANE